MRETPVTQDMLSSAKKPQDEAKLTFAQDVVVDRTRFSQLLAQHGVNELKPRFNPDASSRKERIFYLTNNPGIQKRLDFTPIINDQPLAPNFKIRAMERLAGLLPFIKTIPNEVQKAFESGVGEMIPAGYIAKMQGVIMQEEYSLLKVPDVFGIGKHSLDYPRVEIHVYDKEGEFVETLVLDFIDKKTQQRMDAINLKLESTSTEKRIQLLAEADKAFDALDSNGLADKLVTNSKSIGNMAQRLGLTKFDVVEGIIRFGNMKEFLINLDLQAKELHFSPEQKKILKIIQKNITIGEIDPFKKMLPEATLVLDRALQLATIKEGLNGQHINGLSRLALDLHAGYNHFYHNAVRIEGIDKLLGNGEQVNIDKLEKILSSGNLLPREGTFTKGEYLAGVDFGKDDLKNMLPLMFEGPEDVNPEIVMIFEVAKKPIPQFKHEACSLTYIPTDLHKCLRRLIVTRQHMELARLYLDKSQFNNIEVISYEDWLKEVEYISTARDELLPVENTN